MVSVSKIGRLRTDSALHRVRSQGPKIGGGGGTEETRDKKYEIKKRNGLEPPASGERKRRLQNVPKPRGRASTPRGVSA